MVDETDRSRINQYLLMLAAAGTSLIISVSLSVGGKIIAGGETTSGISKQLEMVTDDVKDIKKMQIETLTKQAELYTRREAKEDRDAAERRFQSLESRFGELGGRFGELNNRLGTLETGYRIIERFMDGKPRGGKEDK